MIHIGLMSNIYDGIQRPLKVKGHITCKQINNHAHAILTVYMLYRLFKSSLKVSIFPVVLPLLLWIRPLVGTLNLLTFRYDSCELWKGNGDLIPQHLN